MSVSVSVSVFLFVSCVLSLSLLCLCLSVLVSVSVFFRVFSVLLGPSDIYERAPLWACGAPRAASAGTLITVLGLLGLLPRWK